jgi:hypothetical protein
MFRVREIPIRAVILCTCLAAQAALAQEGPTEDELESAHERLQQALEARGLPPAAFETDPVPDWALPHHEPKVLPGPEANLQPEIPAQPQATAPPAERANTEVVDPNILSSQQNAEKKAEPEKSKAAEKPKSKPKPKKPAVAREKETPKLKSGRAAADTKEQKPKLQQPPAPKLVLPESLRP